MACKEHSTAQAIITLTSASLSLLGGMILILTYSRISEFQTSVHRLLVFLTIADILSAYGYILGTVNFLRLEKNKIISTDPVCKAQSFITTFSCLASFAWTSIIAVHLYLLIKTKKNFQRNRIIKILYHFIGWILPVIATSIVLGMERLGRETNSSVTGLWCWIKVTNSGDGISKDEKVIMFMSGKLWEIMTYILSFCVYMMLKFNTYQERKNDSSYSWSSIPGVDLRDEDERFCFTWLILYVLRFWGTIRFFIAIYNDNSGLNCFLQNFLKYFQCAGDSAQARGNFVLFCVFDKNIRRKYRQAVAGWCKNTEQQDLTSRLHYKIIGPLIGTYDTQRFQSSLSNRYSGVEIAPRLDTRNQHLNVGNRCI